MKWIALFSQTGTEILNVSKRLNVYPDKIICNGSINNINKELISHKPIHFTRSKPDLMDYKHLLGPDPVLVTLHGWLRIIPKEVCESYSNIWNLHPGLITKYPELKGKDPQERVFNNRDLYPDIGVVIHKVVPKVDDGPVVLQKSIRNTYKNKNDVYHNLHSIATEAWIEYLNEMV